MIRAEIALLLVDHRFIETTCGLVPTILSVSYAVAARGRAAERAGVTEWLAALEAGLDLAQVASVSRSDASLVIALLGAI